MNTASETIESQLIEASSIIGCVAKKNKQYTHGLALRLSKIDKPLGQLTIDELLEQIGQLTFGFNLIFGGAE